MIESRKDDHIRIASEQNVEEGNNLFNEVHLIHIALPEIDLDDVDTEITIFNKKLSFPFIIGAMTGGTETAERINATLARCAEEFGIGMYVAPRESPLLSLRRLGALGSLLRMPPQRPLR